MLSLCAGVPGGRATRSPGGCRDRGATSSDGGASEQWEASMRSRRYDPGRSAPAPGWPFWRGSWWPGDHARATEPEPGHTASSARLQPTGQGVDWSKATKVVAEIPGRVHCFSMLTDDCAAGLGSAQARRGRRPRLGATSAVDAGSGDISRRLPGAVAIGASVAVRRDKSGGGRGDSTVQRSRRALGQDDHLWIGAAVDWAATTMTSSMKSIRRMSARLFVAHDEVLVACGARVRRASSVVEKAVSKNGRAIALLLCDESSKYARGRLRGEGVRAGKDDRVPCRASDPVRLNKEALLVSYQLSGSVRHWVVISGEQDTLRNLGRYLGFDIVRARLLGRGGEAGRRVADAPRVERPLVRRRQRSPKVDQRWPKLLGRTAHLRENCWSASGTAMAACNIWLQCPGGEATQLTHGHGDVEPRFSPAGHQWAYADYARKSIMLCSFDTHSCRVLREDELPSSPAFSPDGQNLAYLAQVGAQQLKIVSDRRRKRARVLGRLLSMRPSLVVVVEDLEPGNLGGHYIWWERDTTTGAKTGNHLDVENRGEPRSKSSVRLPRRRARSISHVRAERKEVSRLLYLQ